MIKGIDVSVLNGKIDWRAVYNDGVRFAMIKATQGRGEGASTKHLRRFTDGRFYENLAAATSAGIACGVYHYFTAKTVKEANEEAAYFLSVITPKKDQITLWAAVDVESFYLDGIKPAPLGASVRAFCDAVKAAGFPPMLYSNPNFLVYRFGPHVFDDTPIWLAHYRVSKPMQVPNTKIWQYGYTKVNGVSGNVDGNEGYFDLPQKEEVKVYRVGDTYIIKKGDIYSNNKAVPARLYGKEFTVQAVLEGRILLREIYSWVKVPK